MSEATAEVMELHPYRKLFGQAAIQDEPAQWLEDCILEIVKAEKVKSVDEAVRQQATRLIEARGELNTFKNKTREICVEYYKGGQLCKEESETIAERLSLEPWWSRKFAITVPVSVTLNVEVEGDDDPTSDAVSDLINISVESSSYGTPEGWEVDDVDFDVDTYSIEISEES